jgi:hypothetical protein
MPGNHPVNEPEGCGIRRKLGGNNEPWIGGNTRRGHRSECREAGSDQDGKNAEEHGRKKEEHCDSADVTQCPNGEAVEAKLECQVKGCSFVIEGRIGIAGIVLHGHWEL